MGELSLAGKHQPDRGRRPSKVYIKDHGAVAGSFDDQLGGGPMIGPPLPPWVNEPVVLLYILAVQARTARSGRLD